MKRFLLFYCLCISFFVCSQTISGVVVSEEDHPISKVLIVNMSSNQKVYTDNFGNFSIAGKMGDELRFAKEKYKGERIKINNDLLKVILQQLPQEIEEVKIVNKRLAETQEEKLRKDIGLPKGSEKPREKPADLADDFLRIPPKVNIQNIYDAISGKSRRLKRLYKYEDLQEGLAWIQNNIDLEYFAEAGISPEKFNDFLMFALQDEKVLMYMKAKNIGGLTVSLDNHIGAYMEKIAKK
ncbi:hypothetical protein [Epilithonimonas hominis]|uniref:Carboxypeptidase regulatory-like domain-containing protein n=1 Tax=Epilithonimonas hominis TaxID=420404 RepID=A0A1H6J9E7_9FLAO|nr:hypothetical protein [Epilithonimonas hominis]SEH55587.1 hypothetical protein SAMN05421793_11152 [Epilithonimonas hominis]